MENKLRCQLEKFPITELVPQRTRVILGWDLKELSEKLKEDIYINTFDNNPELTVTVFANDCSDCRKLLEKMFPFWSKEYKVNFHVNYYNLRLHEKVYELLLTAGEEFGHQDSKLPVIFTGNHSIPGLKEIEEFFPGEIKTFLASVSNYNEKAIKLFTNNEYNKSIKEKSFENLTLWLVIGAGFIDGINPCAFSTLIFLISYISLIGAGRKKILLTGIFFTLSILIEF